MAADAGRTHLLGGDLSLHRLGLGTMRLTGAGAWGPPAEPDTVRTLLRRAVDLGIDFVDTADAYGPEVGEELIREALHPYDGVTIATKGGYTRPGPDEWAPKGDPEHLRSSVDGSLRRLGLDRIDLYQLHRVDPAVPIADQLGTLKDLQGEGKIRHVGLSAVTVEQVELARNFVDVASVQNKYNFGERGHDPVVDYCADEGIAFIPYAPVGEGALADGSGVLGDVAKRYDVPAAQVALAWLLRRAPVVVAIPGTSDEAHLVENVGAADLADRLTSRDVADLTAA